MINYFVCGVVCMSCVFIALRGYYKIAYSEWIKHPINLNLLLKQNTYYYCHSDIQLDFSQYNTNNHRLNIKSFRYNDMSHLQKALVRPFIKELDCNDNDIISFQTQPSTLANHYSKKTIQVDSISACITSCEIQNKSGWKGFFINNIVFIDQPNTNPATKRDIFLHHLHYQLKYNIKHIQGFFKNKIVSYLNPLTLFSTYIFPIAKWKQPPSQGLHPQFKIVPMSKQNFHFFSHFMKSFSNDFDYIVHINIDRIIRNIESSRWISYMVIVNDLVVATFFFNIIENNILHCFASVNKCGNDNAFIHAFKLSFWNIAIKNKLMFASIDLISHNKIIIENIMKKTHPYSITSFAYYCYNYSHSFVQNGRCFLLL